MSLRVRLAVLLALALVPVVAITATPASAQLLVARVTTNADDGPGSFRAALEEAASRPLVDTIVFDRGLGEIVANTELLYESSDAIVIKGNGNVIRAGALDDDTLHFVGHGPVTISDLKFIGGPGDSIDRDIEGDGHGLVRTTLINVEVQGADQSALDIYDDYTGFGVEVVIKGSLFQNNSREEDDEDDEHDQVNITEYDKGDLKITVESSNIVWAVADDGFRAAENGDGALHFTASNSAFNNNGGAKGGDTNNDGVVIAECDAGNLVIDLNNVEINDNADDGIDGAEAGEGSLFLTGDGVTANRNGEDALDIDEDSPGDFEGDCEEEFEGGGDWIGSLKNSTFEQNFQSAFDVDEHVEGNFTFVLRRVDADRNGTEAGNGDPSVNVDEDGDGNHRLVMINSSASDNEHDGVGAEEEDSGNLRITLIKSDVSRNLGDGIQTDDDSGNPPIVRLFSTIQSNAGLDINNNIL